MACHSPPADGYCSLVIHDDTAAWGPAELTFKRGTGTPTETNLVWTNRALELQNSSDEMKVQFTDNGDMMVTGILHVPTNKFIRASETMHFTSGEPAQRIASFWVGPYGSKAESL